VRIVIVHAASDPMALGSLHEYGFCSRCGSSMLFRSTKWADEIHITLANVQNDIGLQPQAHVYFDTHVDWLNFDDELKRHVDPVVK